MSSKRLTTIEEVDTVLRISAEIATTRANLVGKEGLTYSDPKSNEAALFSVVQSVCLESYDPTSVEHVGGHKFPDVVFPYANAGVEIKCHQKHGHPLLGNSIMGSTFALTKPDAVRLLVWTNSTKSVTVHDYFDSVVSAEVTHSPRFRLLPGAPASDRLFGSGPGQIGTAQDLCLGSDGIKSEVILAKMRALALARGEIPWWIGEDSLAGSHSSFSIIRLSDLEEAQQSNLMSTATFIFPEVIGQGSPTKYHNVVAWAVATRSVLLLRDHFSARGRVGRAFPTLCNEHSFTIPRSFDLALDRLSQKVEVSLTELQVYWADTSLTSKSAIKGFEKRLSEVNLNGVVEAVSQQQCSNCLCTSGGIDAELRALLMGGLNVEIVD